jgi:hypothetical protein
MKSLIVRLKFVSKSVDNYIITTEDNRGAIFTILSITEYEMIMRSLKLIHVCFRMKRHRW